MCLGLLLLRSLLSMCSNPQYQPHHHPAVKQPIIYNNKKNFKKTPKNFCWIMNATMST